MYASNKILQQIRWRSLINLSGRQTFFTQKYLYFTYVFTRNTSLDLSKTVLRIEYCAHSVFMRPVWLSPHVAKGLRILQLKRFERRSLRCFIFSVPHFSSSFHSYTFTAVVFNAISSTLKIAVIVLRHTQQTIHMLYFLASLSRFITSIYVFRRGIFIFS
jgi:hypothetical protein